MPALFEKHQEPMPISELFPDISLAEQHAIQETLDAYCQLLLRIFERLERERGVDFDDFDSAA
jgi:hypothetical protein